MSKAYVGNPVFEFLQTRGLSVMQLLKVTDLDVGAVYQVMEGILSSIPPRIMRELVSLGADEDKLRTAYTKYRAERRKQIMGNLQRA